MSDVCDKDTNAIIWNQWATVVFVKHNCSLIVLYNYNFALQWGTTVHVKQLTYRCNVATMLSLVTKISTNKADIDIDKQT